MGAFRYLLDGLFRLGNRLSRPEALCQNDAYTQKALFRNRHNYVIISQNTSLNDMTLKA